jgi:hypothetical protein
MPRKSSPQYRSREVGAALHRSYKDIFFEWASIRASFMEKNWEGRSSPRLFPIQAGSWLRRTSTHLICTQGGESGSVNRATSFTNSTAHGVGCKDTRGVIVLCGTSTGLKPYSGLFSLPLKKSSGSISRCLFNSTTVVKNKGIQSL